MCIRDRSLRASAILPSIPIWSTGILTEKFPFLKAIRVLSRMLVSRAFEGRSAILVVFITINFLLGAQSRLDCCFEHNVTEITAPQPPLCQKRRKNADMLL